MRAATYLGAMHPIDAPAARSREPIFNIPAVVVALTVVLCAIHAVIAYALSEQAVETVLELFAFSPLRYHTTVSSGEILPGGVPAAIWTFVTYAFLHVNLTHLAFNLIWLVAFGTPVARRFGPWRFLAFFAFTAAAGALAHLVSHLGQDVPAIGASAAVLGMMAAAMRFVFQPGGPLGLLRLGEENTYRVPAKPLGAMLRDRRALLFVLVWFQAQCAVMDTAGFRDARHGGGRCLAGPCRRLPGGTSGIRGVRSRFALAGRRRADGQSARSTGERRHGRPMIRRQPCNECSGKAPACARHGLGRSSVCFAVSHTAFDAALHQ